MRNRSKRKKVTIELMEPAFDTVEGAPATDIIDEEGTDGTSVIRGGDGSEALLAGGVPYLGLYLLGVNFHHLSLELNSDSGL